MDREYKIVVVGNGGCGKTSFVKRLVTGDFTTRYVPTLGVEVYGLENEDEKLKFSIWDCAGVPELCGLKDAYYIQADGAMILYDDNTSKDDIRQNTIDIIRVCGKEIPIVYCRTKSDLPSTKKLTHGHISISSKSCDNLSKPLHELVKLIKKRQLTV